MEQSLEEQILSAIELFHYSYKFRESTFGIVLDSTNTLLKILPDLKVLQSSRIKTFVILPATPGVEDELARLNKRGYSFDLTTITPHDETPKRRVRADMYDGDIAVITIAEVEIRPFSPCSFYDAAFSAAQVIGARKVFFPGPIHGLEVEGLFQSHPTLDELRGFLSANKQMNLIGSFIEYLLNKKNFYGFDIIILEAKVGTLYQEIFSHRGAGTLLSNDYQSVFRKARHTDTSDIALLMKPYIRAGLILPLTEDEIIEALEDFYVYTINGQIVASAKLTDYGESAEIGKICTLPRYQRKGRARAITEKIIELARSKGKKWVFSLSTQEKMFVFFKQLGFTEVSRETLPEAWKAHYDFSRPSRSFRLDL